MKEIAKDLEREIMQAANKALRATAEEITYQIENAYENAIDKFYQDYTPRWYGRTHSTYLASSGYNYFGKNVKQVGKNSFIAGIEVDSGLMGSPYKADTSWVFSRTFERGIHGYTNKEAREWSDKERHLYFSPTGKMMRPTPEVLMNKDFRHITRAANIEDLFAKFFTL